MAFSPKKWLNRVTEFPNRRKLSQIEGEDDLYYIDREEGEVHTEGDKLDADSLNDLEGRIAQGFDDTDTAIQGNAESILSLETSLQETRSDVSKRIKIDGDNRLTGAFLPAATERADLGQRDLRFGEVYSRRVTADKFTGDLEGNAETASKLNNPLTINDVTYDGSKAENINLDDAYLKKTGDTMLANLYMNAKGIFDCTGLFSSSGNVVVGAVGTGNVYLQSNGTQWTGQIGNTFRPLAAQSGNVDLGSTEGRWRDIHLTRNAYIGGDITLQGELTAGSITGVSTDDLRINSPNNNVVIRRAGSNVAYFDGNGFIPSSLVAAAYDLGKQNNQWRRLYLSGNAIAPAPPTDDAHLANKAYVDSVVGTGGGKRFATITIGNEDQGHTKDEYDYVAQSKYAQGAINSAINQLSGSGGKIVLAEGLYIIDGDINISENNISIEGQGKSTVIQASPRGIVNITGSRCSISDMYFATPYASNSGFVQVVGNDVNISNVHFYSDIDMTTRLAVYGNNCHLNNIVFKGTSTGQKTENMLYLDCFNTLGNNLTFISGSNNNRHAIYYSSKAKYNVLNNIYVEMFRRVINAADENVSGNIISGLVTEAVPDLTNYFSTDTNILSNVIFNGKVVG